MEEKWRELREACRNGDMNKVLQLVNQGCNPRRNVNFSHKRQPIHYAAAHGHLELVRTLIERCGCRPDWKDLEGRTALHYACCYGRVDVVSYLVTDRRCSYYIYAEDRKQGKMTPMHYACQFETVDSVNLLEGHRDYGKVVQSESHYEVMKFLVNAGFDPTTCKQEGGRNVPLALHVACRYGTRMFVKYLTERCKYDPEQCNARSETPLLLACQLGKLEIVKYFIEEVHCDMNKCHNWNGNNCLHVACLHDQTVVVKYFVEKGCDLTIRNHKNETPLHIACSNGSLEMARLVSIVPQAYETKKSQSDGTQKRRAPSFASYSLSSFFLQDSEYYDYKSHPSPLHVACKQGEVEIVKHLITEKSWNPELQYYDGSTPLHSACCSHVAGDPKNTLEVVRFLVDECNSDPMKSCGSLRRKASHNGSPMSVACKAGKPDLVVALTSKNVNCQDTSGNTPLHLACEYVNLMVVKYLVEEKQCNLTIQNAKRQLPVHIACESKSLELVKLVSDCDLNILTIDQQTPLHIACKDGTLDIIDYLVIEKQFQHPENSASLYVHAMCKAGNLELVKVLATTQNVRLQDYHSDGNSPLHIACKYKHLKLAMYLVNEVHSDMLQRNKMGELPLHIACQEEALDIVQFLVLEKYCPQDIKNNDGELPLHIACRKKSLEMAKLVVHDSQFSTHTLSTSALHCNGTTPLHIACQEEALDIVKYLCVEKRADLNIINNKGELPLHIACSKHSLEMVKLVSDCADPNAKAHRGDTPLHIACKHGDINIVKYLLEEKQCNPKLKNLSGELPLHYACMHSSVVLV